MDDLVYLIIARICGTNKTIFLYSPESFNHGDKVGFHNDLHELMEAYVLAVDTAYKDDNEWHLVATATGMEPKQAIIRYAASEIKWEVVENDVLQ